jgi:hypothetical protein
MADPGSRSSIFYFITNFKTMAKKGKSQLFKTKKEVEQTYKDSLFETIASGAGTVLTGFGFNAVRDKIPAKLQRFAGVGLVGLGAAGNVFGKDPKVKAFSTGVSDYGFLQAVMDLKPDMAAKIAVMPMNGILSGSGKRILSNDDYARIAEELENGGGRQVNGLGAPEEEDQAEDLFSKMV